MVPLGLAYLARNRHIVTVIYVHIILGIFLYIFGIVNVILRRIFNIIYFDKIILNIVNSNIAVYLDNYSVTVSNLNFILSKIRNIKNNYDLSLEESCDLRNYSKFKEKLDSILESINSMKICRFKMYFFFIAILRYIDVIIKMLIVVFGIL